MARRKKAVAKGSYGDDTVAKTMGGKGPKKMAVGGSIGYQAVGVRGAQRLMQQAEQMKATNPREAQLLLQRAQQMLRNDSIMGSPRTGLKRGGTVKAKAKKGR